MMLKTDAQCNHLVNPAPQLVRALQMLGLGGVRGLTLRPATAVVSDYLGPRLLPPCLSSLFQADVRNAEALHRTFEGMDCVFHVASYGMSGAEQVRPPHTHRA